MGNCLSNKHDDHEIECTRPGDLYGSELDDLSGYLKTNSRASTASAVSASPGNSNYSYESKASVLSDGTTFSEDTGTAFLHAALSGDLKTVQKLLNDEPSCLDATNAKGRNALMLACSHCHHDITEYLIKAGASINAYEAKHSSTAIMMAASVGDTKSVELLIAAGADLEHRSHHANTALMNAAKTNHADIVALLLKAGAKIEAANVHKQTSLIIASVEGHACVVSELLKANANVDAVNKYGSTGMMCAASVGNCNIVEQLLAAGAHYNMRNIDGECAFTFAVRNGHADIVRVLLAAGASPETQDKAGEYAMFIAAQRGHVEVLRVLLDANAPLEATNKDGSTVLLVAAQFGWDEVVAFLIERGAKHDVRNKHGESPVVLAATKNRAKVLKVLLKAGAPLDNVNKNGIKGSALIFASRSKFREVVKVLVDHDVDLDAVDSDGWTALMHAVQQGHMSIVKFLLSAGANKNIESMAGVTARALAFERSETKSEDEDEMLRLLSRNKPMMRKHSSAF